MRMILAQEMPVGAKRAVNLSFDAELLDEARSLGLNLSQSLECKLRDILRQEKERRWIEANRAALDDFDRYIDDNGVFGEEWRTL